MYRLPLLGPRLTSSPRLLAHYLISLLSKRDPDPEPCKHFDKHKRKEDSVLERIAAPTPRTVGRVMRRRVAETGAGSVRGRRGAEKVDVEDETHGEKRAERSCGMLAVRIGLPDGKDGP